LFYPFSISKIYSIFLSGDELRGHGSGRNHADKLVSGRFTCKKLICESSWMFS